MRVTIHPLFIAILLLSVILGTTTFAVAMFAAVIIHELSHVLTASFFGIKSRDLRLLPFGAEVSIDCTYLTTGQKIIVLLSGAFGNIAIALAAGGLLWVLPQYFVLLEYIIIANAVPAILNLLPIYPLDGGKVLYELAQERSQGSAKQLAKVLSIFSSACFVTLFLLSCFLFFNLPLIILCIVMFFNINFELKHTRFVSKINSAVKGSKSKIIEAAVRADMTLLQAYKLVSAKHFTKFVITDKGNAVFYENELENALIKHSLDTKLISAIKG